MTERQSLSEGKMGNPQCQIAKALQISSSTVHNTIKIFRETGEISVRKGQGRRPLLDANGLRGLRQHCITHRHDFVIDITKWAQEYFQKPLSLERSTKALSCKKEAICEHGPEALLCPVGQVGLGTKLCTKLCTFKGTDWIAMVL